MKQETIEPQKQSAWNLLQEIFPHAVKWELQVPFLGKGIPCFTIDLSRLDEAGRGKLLKFEHCLRSCLVPSRQDQMLIGMDEDEWVDRITTLCIPVDALLAKLDAVQESWGQMQSVAALPIRQRETPAPSPVIEPTTAVPASAVTVGEPVRKDDAKRPAHQWLADVFGAENLHELQVHGSCWLQLEEPFIEKRIGLLPQQFMNELQQMAVTCNWMQPQEKNSVRRAEISESSLDKALAEYPERFEELKSSYMARAELTGEGRLASIAGRVRAASSAGAGSTTKLR